MIPRALALLSLAFAAMANTATAAPVGANDPSAAYVAQLAGLINDYRSQHGLPPLELVDDLNAVAGEHSDAMAVDRRLSHDGFRDRFSRTRSRMCVENVGWNYRRPAAQLEGWRMSPGHDRNLLEPKVSRMGIAIAAAYVTFFACR